MKRKLIPLLMLILSLAVAFTLFSCGDVDEPDGGDKKPHTHTASEWVTDTEPTCKTEGTKHKECTECKEVLETSTINKLKHTASEWITDTEPTCKTEGKKHKECAECKEVLETETIAKKEHNYINKECTECKALLASAGLMYTLSDDGKYYAVSGIGNCTDTELIIPSEYNGLPVTTISSSAFQRLSNLTKVFIPDSVESIGSSAFSGCTSLESVTIPFVGATKDGTSDTYFGYIFGANSYEDNIDCVPTSLKNVTITGGSSIGFAAFALCINIINVTIPDSVTSIDMGAFAECTSLTSIVIPDGVTSISEWLFEDCDSLTSVIIPDSVTSIGECAFSCCTSLTSVTIPDSVESIGYDAFSGCYKLVEVYNLSELDITKGSSSNGCVAYYALNVYTPTSGESKMWETDDGFMFYEDGDTCYLLGYKGNKTNITLPQNCNGKNYDIYQSAFENCDSLTSVTIGDSVTSIGKQAFAYCDHITSVTIGNSVTSIGSSAFSVCKSLTSVTIGNSVTHIGDYAFYDCDSLTSVTIPDSVTSIGSYTFSGCTSLQYNEYDNVYYLGNSDNPYLVLIKVKTTDITSVKIHNSTKSIHSYAFAGCDGFTSVTIPVSVTSIGDYAFSGCDSLTSIKVDENNAMYKDIDGNLYSKDGKTLIQYAIGKTATSFAIPDSVTNISENAFAGCYSLTSVTIGNSVTSIGDYAFWICTSLTIYCEPESQPSGWDSYWNYSNCPVVWGYKGN